MKRLKNITATLLILALIITDLTLFNIVTAQTNTNDVYYYKQRLANGESWESIRSELGLPFGVPRYSTNGFELNFNIWLDTTKRITVYGSYLDIQNNDFTEGTQNSTGVCYYKDSSGKAGEYRYHGFDAQGNKYTNIDFINDADSKRKAYEKRWIKEPWKFSKTKFEMSYYNRIAINGKTDEQQQVRQWLKTDFPEFNTIEGTKATDHYNYFNVETPSGLLNYGEAVGYHKTSSGKEWYQTFSLPKVTMKIATPVKAKVEILDTSYKPYGVDRSIQFNGQDSVNIIIRVTSMLMDKDYHFNHIARTMHYTRKDIKNPVFKLANDEGIFKDIPTRNVENTLDANSENYTLICYYRFTLEDNEQNRLNNNLSFSSNTFFEYVGSAGASETATAWASTPIEWEDPIMTDFNINQAIVKKKGEEINLKDISYSDASRGQIDNYFYVMEDKNKILSYINFNLTTPDKTSINTRLKNFLQPYVSNAPADQESTYTFELIQQVRNNATKYTTSKKKTITLTITPDDIITTTPTPTPTPTPDNGESGSNGNNGNGGNEDNKVKLTAIPDVYIPSDVLDIVPMTEAYDRTEGYISRTITIDGVPVNNIFDSYIWGDNADGFHLVKIEYESNDGLLSEYITWVLVHDTKPQAGFKISGTFKENRLLTIVDNTYYADSYINELLKNPIYKALLEIQTEYNNESPYIKRSSSNGNEFIYKSPGIYTARLTANNKLRSTKNLQPVIYDLSFMVMEDNEPALNLNIWNSVIARNEPLEITYNAESVDNDHISFEKVNLYYDQNNDQSFSQYVGTYSIGQLKAYKPTKLGSYKVVAYARESFGQPTVQEHITDTDYKSLTLTRYFHVDNYRPSTTISVDIPMVLPKVDVFLLLDQSLHSAKTSKIKQETMNSNNYLRKNNLLPTYNIWDLHTYSYSASASHVQGYGTNYPPSPYYYSVGSYSGTLSLTNVSDNGRWIDKGKYITATQSKTFTATHTNTVSSYGWTNPWEVLGETQSSPAPSTKYINQDGYSGNIPRTDTVTLSDTGWVFGIMIANRIRWTRQSSFLANYSGVLTKSTQVWQPELKWVSDYTGYYSGTVYRSEKQSFSNPFRVDAKRYMIYVSDSNISNISDLNQVKNNNDVSVILIGNSAASSQITHQHFILNDGTDINTLVTKALNWIIEQNPLNTESFTVLSPFSFNMTTGNHDEENDTISAQEFLYVHDENYYDNSEGIEPNCAAAYSSSVGWTTEKKNKLNKPGAYTVYRRIKDEATTEPAFESFNKTSNEPYFKVNIHRKPIALADMKWKYDPVSSLYKLTFIDKGFDLDHNITREDKGIEETMIRYKKLGSTEWNYKMPTDITAGSYTIEYYVKDIEKVWSDAYTLNVTLNTVPTADITIDSGIQFKEPVFRNDNTIPAGETIQITSSDKASGVIIRSNVPITTAEVYINNIKIGNLTLTQQETQTEYIYTAEIMDYIVPTSAIDGNLDIRIKAISSVNNQYKENTHTVGVYTPIWEDYSKGRLSYISEALTAVPSSIFLCNTTDFEEKESVKIVTSKYTDKIKVNIKGITFYLLSNGKLSSHENGTSSTNEIKVTAGANRYKVSSLNISTGSYKRTWSFDIAIVEAHPISNGEEFDLKLTGYDKAGNSSTSNNKHSYNPRIKALDTNTLKITNVTIEGYWNHWRGQVDMFGKQMTVEPHRFLSYECVKINVYTTGYADKVVIRFSPELESMTFTDKFGNVYKYKDDIEYEVYFPEDSTAMLKDTVKDNKVSWEYTLPLAPSTKSWEDKRLKSPYKMIVTAWKGSSSVVYEVDDIDITGNIYDLIYIQPVR